MRKPLKLVRPVMPRRSIKQRKTHRELTEKIGNLREALEDAEQFIDLYVNGFASVESGLHTLVHIKSVLSADCKNAEAD